MHIRFDDLPRDRRPRSDSAHFSKAWQTETADAEFLEEGIRRWREQTRKPSPTSPIRPAVRRFSPGK
jgi:hypothetical protein